MSLIYDIFTFLTLFLCLLLHNTSFFISAATPQTPAPAGETVIIMVRIFQAHVIDYLKIFIFSVMGLWRDLLF